METVVRTLDELAREATRVIAALAPRVQGATLITLSGELGAGKTAFVQALAKALGVVDTVTSPTFVLEKIYQLPPDAARPFERLVHIDAYRLDGRESLAPLGFDELMSDPGNLVVLEWPEHVAGLLEPAVHIHFVLRADGSRTLTHES